MKNNYKEYSYKGFGIIKQNRVYEIYIQGIKIRECKTLKEVKERIDNQTI